MGVTIGEDGGEGEVPRLVQMMSYYFRVLFGLPKAEVSHQSKCLSRQPIRGDTGKFPDFSESAASAMKDPSRSNIGDFSIEMALLDCPFS